jgi:hypothetical protein
MPNSWGKLGSSFLTFRNWARSAPARPEIRYRVWPFVQNLLGKQYQGFDPVDFHPQVAKVRLVMVFGPGNFQIMGLFIPAL